MHIGETPAPLKKVYASGVRLDDWSKCRIGRHDGTKVPSNHSFFGGAGVCAKSDIIK